MAKGYTFKLLTVESAKNLSYGTVLYHVNDRDSKGNPRKWRVSSAIKTWKSARYANRVEFSVKHGLYDNDRVNNAIIDSGILAVSYTEK